MRINWYSLPKNRKQYEKNRVHNCFYRCSIVANKLVSLTITANVNLHRNIPNDYDLVPD